MVKGKLEALKPHTVLIIVDTDLEMAGADVVNVHISRFVRGAGQRIYGRIVATNPGEKTQRLIDEGFVQRVFSSPASLTSVDDKGGTLLGYLQDSNTGIVDVVGVGDNVRNMALDLKSNGFKDVSAWPGMFTLGNKTKNDALTKEIVVH